MSGDLALFDVTPDPTLVARNLVDDYVVPPFTTLDTRQGYWQDRKREWLALGIKSELGRDDALTYGKFDMDYMQNFGAWGSGSTSIFDPVLCEIAYRWFSPADGVVIDPFAGGSVRGIVAAALGRTYHGIELRPEQVASNRAQAEYLIRPEQGVPTPRWIAGDSNDVLSTSWEGEQVPSDADLIFTCPPYADLEVYSDDPADLSNVEASEFDRLYQSILAKAVDRLRDDAFCVVVIGNTRYKRNGALRDLVGLTINACEEAGAFYYNEAILLNNVGTGAVRARKQMQASRKLVRLHQQVLVFAKGDPRKATARIEGRA